MKQRTFGFLRASAFVALAATVCLVVLERPSHSRPQASRAAPRPAKKAPAPAAAKSLPPALLQTDRNIGKAYYEQGKYAEAVEQFQKVVASGHALATDHLNLGLALMQANRLNEALGELTTAQQMDPKLVAAEYNLGILYKRELRYPDAEVALKQVIAADPNDPAAWFNLGTVYFAERKLEESLDAHQHVVKMGFAQGQNFYVASLFHTFTTLIRLKEQEEAQKVLKIHERMRDKVPGISLQNPALEGGKYGAIIVPATPPTMPGGEEKKVAFAEITQKLGISWDAQPLQGSRRQIKSSDYSLDFAKQKLIPLFGPSIAVGDYDGDGHPDLYVVNPGGTNHLFHNNGDGTFTDVTEKAGVAGPGSSLSATFADFNNSGKASLFVVGLDGVRLYVNKGDGVFADETAKAGLEPWAGELDTRAVLFDADNDGFVDLVVTGYTDLTKPPQKDSFTFPDDFAGARLHFCRNNGNGTFTEITSSTGLGAAEGHWRGAAFADFNNDGYTDLFVYRDNGSPFVFENHGEDHFSNRSGEPAFRNLTALDAQVADFNHDGYFDLALWSPQGCQVLLNRRGWKFEPVPKLPAITPPSGPFAFRGLVADLDGDSYADLLGVDAQGRWHLMDNRAGKFREVTFNLPASPAGPVGYLVAAWLSNPGKLDLVGITRGGRFAAYDKEGPPARWVEVKLSGYKSNTQGVGSVVEFKAGNFYDKVLATGGPVRVFTGDLTKLDVVRVTWPNAVVQNWIEVATNKPIEVRESERLASSCPLLYGWDGKKFVFLTDVLGVAPLGELAPDGSRIKPDPEELVRLPRGLRAQNGAYVFQLTDELREVDYFDQVRLLAVDHPAREEIYSNEIYSSSPSQPRLYVVREKLEPVSAFDDHGHDVLPLVRKADGRYPTDFRRNRILGLAELHSITVDLGAFQNHTPTSLWLKGWVFWTDSNASRALMFNPQKQLVPPYLQVRNTRGEWTTVIPDMGLPSGTNRTMRVDLTGKFPSADHHVRIVTNLCVYWDQIFFTHDDAEAPATVELPLVAADLHYRGFSMPVNDPQHLQPDTFDYLTVMSRAPWNPMGGRYTRYGAVAPLLRQADDRLVIMATGDELTVKFQARGLPSLRPGWVRDLFLDAHGYAKDGEPNTAFAKTVTPLPFRAMANYPPGPPDPAPQSDAYRQYLRDYVTRTGYALIPPLAPAVDSGLGTGESGLGKTGSGNID